MIVLFVYRYEGEKEETRNETKHLSELLKRIEDRKRERVGHDEYKSTKDEELQNKNVEVPDSPNLDLSSDKPKKAKSPTKKTDKQTDFIVLGAKSKQRKREVKRVLPEWLANPSIISMDLNSGPSIEQLVPVLDSKLIEVLKVNGIDKLFPVQASMVTWLLDCNKDRQQGWWLRDTCVSAPTGSGTNI